MTPTTTTVKTALKVTEPIPDSAASRPKTVVSARVPEELFMWLRDYTIEAGHLNMSETVAEILGKFRSNRSRSRSKSKLKQKLTKGKKK